MVNVNVTTTHYDIVVICGGPLEFHGNKDESEMWLNGRIEEALKICRNYRGLPVIVTGAGDAEILRNKLARQIGLNEISKSGTVACILVEGSSRTTLENSVKAKSIMQRKGLKHDRIAVITSDFHLPVTSSAFDFFFPDSCITYVGAATEELSRHHWDSLEEKLLASWNPNHHPKINKCVLFQNKSKIQREDLRATRSCVYSTPTNQFVFPRGFCIQAMFESGSVESEVFHQAATLLEKSDLQKHFVFPYRNKEYPIVLCDLLWEGNKFKGNHRRYGRHVTWDELAIRIEMDIGTILSSSPWTSFTCNFNAIKDVNCISLKCGTKRSSEALSAYQTELYRVTGLDHLIDQSLENMEIKVYLAERLDPVENTTTWDTKIEDQIRQQMKSILDPLGTMEIGSPLCTYYKEDGSLEILGNDTLKQYRITNQLSENTI